VRVVGGLIGVVGGLLSFGLVLTDCLSAVAGPPGALDATLWWRVIFSGLCTIFGALTLRTQGRFAPIALALSAAFGMIFSVPGDLVAMTISLFGGALALFASFSQEELTS
jgi:hypothetical protein